MNIRNSITGMALFGAIVGIAAFIVLLGILHLIIPKVEAAEVTEVTKSMDGAAKRDIQKAINTVIWPATGGYIKAAPIMRRIKACEYLQAQGVKYCMQDHIQFLRSQYHHAVAVEKEMKRLFEVKKALEEVHRDD